MIATENSAENCVVKPQRRVQSLALLSSLAPILVFHYMFDCIQNKLPELNYPFEQNMVTSCTGKARTGILLSTRPSQSLSKPEYNQNDQLSNMRCTQLVLRELELVIYRHSLVLGSDNWAQMCIHLPKYHS